LALVVERVQRLEARIVAAERPDAGAVDVAVGGVELRLDGLGKAGSGGDEARRACGGREEPRDRVVELPRGSRFTRLVVDRVAADGDDDSMLCLA
jgi:hypothetical protein